MKKTKKCFYQVIWHIKKIWHINIFFYENISILFGCSNLFFYNNNNNNNNNVVIMVKMKYKKMGKKNQILDNEIYKREGRKKCW